MTSSQFGNPNLERSELKRVKKSRTATIVLLGIIACASIVVAGWFAGEVAIERIFTHLHAFQENPPMWLQVPMVMGEYEWFNLRRVVQLQVGAQKFWGVTTAISEVGTEIALTQAGITLDYSQPVTMQIVEDELIIPVKIVQTSFKDEFSRIKVTFEQINLDRHRRLVEMLFCRPGQWKRQDTPGEFQSLLLIFRILLKPRVIFDRKIDINAIAVSQG